MPSKSSKAPKKPKLETRSLKSLKPFPMQSTTFRKLSESDLQALADDIRQHGLKHPIEIMPDGTVLCGHQRWLAMLLLGWLSVKMLVRYDLANADLGTLEKVFLLDNLNRRQLDPLERARVALRLFESEKGRSISDSTDLTKNTARDRIGKLIGISGRNLSRYFNILLCDIAVQEAFRAGKLTLVQASRIGTLQREDRAEVTKRIREGETPSDVVADFLETPKRKPRKASKVLRTLTAQLDGALDEIEPRIDKIRGSGFLGFSESLSRAQRCFGQILRNLKRAKEDDRLAEERRAKNLEEIGTLVGKTKR